MYNVSKCLGWTITYTTQNQNNKLGYGGYRVTCRWKPACWVGCPHISTTNVIAPNISGVGSTQTKLGVRY